MPQMKKAIKRATSQSSQRKWQQQGLQFRDRKFPSLVWYSGTGILKSPLRQASFGMRFSFFLVDEIASLVSSTSANVRRARLA
jgi:hypothetical protein